MNFLLKLLTVIGDILGKIVNDYAKEKRRDQALEDTGELAEQNESLKDGQRRQEAAIEEIQKDAPIGLELIEKMREVLKAANTHNN